MEFTKLEVPLPEDLARELYAFWERIFGPGDMPLELFLGSERRHNDNTVYLMRQGERLAGTCMLTVSRAAPMLGGFGEVATEPDLRRGGVATRVCSAAVEDFRDGAARPYSWAPATPMRRASTTASAGAGWPGPTYGPTSPPTARRRSFW